MTIDELERYIPCLTEIITPEQFRNFLVKKALKMKKNGILKEKRLKVGLRLE